MEVNDIITLISNVGFPIVCCGVLFWLNYKLQQTINDLKSTLTENTTLLKQLIEKEE